MAVIRSPYYNQLAWLSYIIYLGSDAQLLAELNSNLGSSFKLSYFQAIVGLQVITFFLASGSVLSS